MKKPKEIQPGVITYYDTNGNIVLHDDTKYYPNISLRDYFAGQALAGLLSDPKVLVAANKGSAYGQSTKLIAEAAYDAADAMLQAREND